MEVPEPGLDPDAIDGLETPPLSRPRELPNACSATARPLTHRCTDSAPFCHSINWGANVWGQDSGEGNWVRLAFPTSQEDELSAHATCPKSSHPFLWSGSNCNAARAVYSLSDKRSS
eukprot:4757439-Amphidinium_carterae.3